MEEDIFEDESPSRLKRAVIAGASEALKMKKDWKRSDEDVLQSISDNIEIILKNID